MKNPPLESGALRCVGHPQEWGYDNVCPHRETCWRYIQGKKDTLADSFKPDFPDRFLVDCRLAGEYTKKIEI